MKLRTLNMLAGSSFMALASTAGAQPALEGRSTVALEEVVVTARRREESIEDVPQVVNAVTSEALAKYNIQQFKDVQALVPGLTLSSSGDGTGVTASIRGVDFNVSTSTSSTVSFYVNDVTAEGQALFHTMFDLGQIEVLRGPQGTLRGRSAPSGAITITTRKADVSEMGGYAEIVASDRDSFKANGAFNMPLIQDVLAVRVAGVTEDTRYDHVKSINSSVKPSDNTDAGRISLTFQPNDALNVALTYQRLKESRQFFRRLTGTGAPGLPFGSGACNIQGSTGLIEIPCPRAGYNGPVLEPGDGLAVSNQSQNYHLKDDRYTAQLEYRLGGQKLSYVGGYYGLNFDTSGLNPDSSNMVQGGPVQREFSPAFLHKNTHELRLASEERIADVFDYTVGLYYDRERGGYNLRWPAAYLPGAFGSPLGLPSTSILDNRYLVHTYLDGTHHNDEKSVFVSLTWHASEQTELTVGGRYIDYKTADGTVINLVSDGLIALPAASLGLPPGVPCSAAGFGQTYANTCDVPSTFIPQLQNARVLNNLFDESWNPTVWNASLSHAFSEDLRAYVNYGTAWRRASGVIGIQNASNDPVLTAASQSTPEKSKGWEVGLKSKFLDGRGKVNVALFHQKFDGYFYQTPLVTYLGDSGTGVLVPQQFRFTANVPAVVEGIDLDAAFQLTEGWSMGLAASYADGHMENATIPCNAPIPPGQSIALCTGSDIAISTAPEWSANLSSEYSRSLTADLEGYVRGLFNYYPENDRASGEGSGFTADAYGLLNLFAGVRSADGAWDVQLFARNVTDTQKTLTLNSNMERSSVSPIALNFGPTGYFETGFTPKREFGVTVRYSFGSR